ncbi:TLR4 regulator and MIR-interacting MSAP, putative [Leishmania lindenbergi]|uniref:TLR4 regulator and MIR-interacting MSAP n=1 Tax=Leishmania lindenbergi TaxID=651832 RepID=A0AAW2ZZB6_9TRYP
MRAPSTPLLAPLQRNQRHFLLAVIALLVNLFLASSLTLAATPAQGKSIRPLHGAGYEHLDCSACITVARTLFNRLNKTLAENPSTYLVSHRLSKQNQLRRRQYRSSELLVSEVMENVCASYQNDDRLLRLHPKSKVRLYHQQIFGDARLGVRHALREDEVYPADADPAAWDKKLDGHLYPIARLYSVRDADALHGMQSLSATPTMCALLVEEAEEEIEELVKTARTQAEVEYRLCGMAFPLNKSFPTLDGETKENEVSSAPLITNVCVDVEVLRAAARRDQERWEQYQRREAKRKVEIAQRMENAADVAGAATSELASEASTNTEVAVALDSSTPAAAGKSVDSSTEEVTNNPVGGGDKEVSDNYTDGEL